MRVPNARDRRRSPAAGPERPAPQLGASRTPFAEALRGAMTDQQKVITRADLEAIDRAAQQLKEAPTLENLNRYKQALADVLAELLDAYAVDELRGFSRFGKRRIHVLLRIVDQKKDELARLVLSNAKDTLTIAARIDDIRGILLDLLQ